MTIRRTAFTVGATALAALGVMVVVALLRPSAPMSLSQQAAQLEAQLRCPDCQGLSVVESQTTAAAAIRTEVEHRLATGQTPEEVRAYFVSRYGEWILLEPASFPWWLLPFGAMLLGAAGLVAWLWAGRKRADRGRRAVAGSPETASLAASPPTASPAASPPTASVAASPPAEPGNPRAADAADRIREEVEALDA